MMLVVLLKAFKNLLRLMAIAIAVFAVMAPLAYFGYQKLWIPFSDNYVLSHADPAMIALADEAGMSRAGELVFLRTDPQLVSDTVMETACEENTAANNSNGFIEQGCYNPSSNRIYLRAMPDNLHELEVSTAAYEMLHPVYISLHGSDQSKALDASIEANYKKLADAHLTAQVANFAKTEPDARDLELFSLLGVGYTNLSPDLASYYLPYFSDIAKTVAADSAVQQLFDSSRTQLDQIRAQIDRYSSLADDAYNQSVASAQAGSQYWDDYYYRLYQADIAKENASIDQYNVLLVSYNALVTEYNGTQPVQKLNPALTQGH